MQLLDASKGFRRLPALFSLWLATSAAFGQFAPNRYALVLEDPPVAARYASSQREPSAAATTYRQQIEVRQRALRSQLAARSVQVTGSASTLLNAIFVAAPETRVAEMRSFAGVAAVVPLRRYRRSLSRAATLVNAPPAWTAAGGQANGGAGLKIGILDTGIDETHPAFQDASLTMPPGFPKCAGSDCAFTNNKVIAARSYVRMLAAGTDPSNLAADSRPDDYSPRDREGHGTALASAAAGVSNTGAVTFSGIAPKAWLGNYKIYGSPEVNDFASDDVIIQALEDAVADGMNIISFSTGGAALTGPLDTGSACGRPNGVPCDLVATAFETAARAGVIIVAAAGNEENAGTNNPSYGTISSPANAPSVIAVGATTNSHYFYGVAVSASAPDAPSSLKWLPAEYSDATFPSSGAVSAPLVDVAKLDGTGLACSALPAYSLDAKFALIKRGDCDFSVKAANAFSAGAVGVVFYMATSDPLASPGEVWSYTAPIVMISQTDGQALQAYLATHPDAPVDIDPNGQEVEWPNYNELAVFSSLGPTAGDASIKPDLVAPGEDIYMATQSYDPLGFMHSSSRYASASGTSFSAPIVAGAAALVKQLHPGYTAAQVRSALVNTASQDVTKSESSATLPMDPRALGAGKLNAGAAVSATVAVTPTTFSFGEITTSSLPLSRELEITNTSANPVTLTLAASGTGTAVSLNRTSLTLLAGAREKVTVSLAGSTPTAGAYSGAVSVQGTGTSLRVPYLYMVPGSTTPNLIALTPSGFIGTVGLPVPGGVVAFKAVDEYGLPLRGWPVRWEPDTGARFADSDAVTDNYGVARARPVLGLTPGSYSFTATLGGTGGPSVTFSSWALGVPTILPNGVVNAASFESRAPLAPGSYVAIFGTGLSYTENAAFDARLPLAIDYVRVSFDVPSAGISVPAPLTYVSPNQVNVQVPWELQGQTSAQMKVAIDYSYGNVVTVPLANYAPAFFEISTGVVAALDAANQLISASHPAQRGTTIQLYANGLGPVANQPPSGEPAPLSPLCETTTQPVVTIGGRDLPAAWSGLTPTLPGLYQVNVALPSNLATGTLPIAIRIGGKTSPSSGLTVQ